MVNLEIPGFFQKSTSRGWGVEDMEFPGVLKEEHDEIPVINSKRSRFPAEKT